MASALHKMLTDSVGTLLEVQSLGATILLIANADETHRKPLLESQGYSVQMASMENAEKCLAATTFLLALTASEGNIATTLNCCERMKSIAPEMRIAVIAERSEYFPPNSAVDAIIRQQHSPRQFLAAVRRLLDVSPLGQQSSSAMDGN